MKSTAIACAIAAGALGLGSLSYAQGFDARGDRDERRGHSQRADRGDRHDRVEQREARRENRQEWRAEQRHQRGQGRHNQYVQQPHQQYQQYQQYRQHDAYRHDGQRSQWTSHAHRYQRGDHLPYQFRQRQYYVNDWRNHSSLYAPPHGYQWVQADGGDYLLVAIATGLIANLLLNQ